MKTKSVNDETLKEQIETLLKDTHCWVTDECGGNAQNEIMQLILQDRERAVREARLDELQMCASQGIFSQRKAEKIKTYFSEYYYSRLAQLSNPTQEKKGE